MNSTKTQRDAADAVFRAGLQKHLGKTTLIVNGVAYTVLELTQLLDERHDAQQAIVSAEAVRKNAVVAHREVQKRTDAILSGICQLLQTTYGHDADALRDFG